MIFEAQNPQVNTKPAPTTPSMVPLCTTPDATGPVP